VKEKEAELLSPTICGLGYVKPSNVLAGLTAGLDDPAE
jgi:hypothetical protein